MEPTNSTNCECGKQPTTLQKNGLHLKGGFSYQKSHCVLSSKETSQLQTPTESNKDRSQSMFSCYCTSNLLFDHDVSDGKYY